MKNLSILKWKNYTHQKTPLREWKYKPKSGRIFFQGVHIQSESESYSVISNSLRPHGLYSPGQNTGVGGLFFSRGSSQPRDQTQVSHIAGKFFTTWVAGKTKNTGVGNLSLLQWTFLTQEWNWGPLHCRWILCQLSNDGSPHIQNIVKNKSTRKWLIIQELARVLNKHFTKDENL